jgi:hypothetical protein
VSILFLVLPGVSFLENLEIAHLILVIWEDIVVILLVTSIFLLITLDDLYLSLFFNSFRHFFIN